MKSIAVVVAGLASLASSYSNSYGQGSDTCAPPETLTITETYHPTETSALGQYPPNQNSADGYNAHYDASAVTVTVTETASIVTITTVTGSVTYGDSYEGSTVTITESNPAYTNSPYYSTSSAIYSNTATTSYGARATHRVEVGTFNGKVQFIPNQVNAEIGDIVEYDFLAKSHSLTQSDFLTPCTYNGGFDTGLNQVNPKNESGKFIIPFEVKTKKPLWFYCKQQGPPNHCGAGMVMGINPGNKMYQFIQNAINQNGNLTGSASSTRAYATGAYATTTATYASSTSTATGAVTTVTVGLMNGTVLKFSPSYLPKVSAGEKIHFDFRAANHTLTESSLYNPCTKLDGTDVDTNFQNVNKADIPELKPFDLVVENDKPRFFYCKQANHTPKSHCGKGMVFAINTDEATFGQFEKNAEATLPKIKGRSPL